MILGSIAAFLFLTAVVLVYGIRVARVGRASDPRLNDAPGSVFLPGWLMEAFYWALHAPGRALADLAIEPDSITWASLGISLLAFPLAATGRFVLAATAIAIGGGLDALDGMVARARGRATKEGAVLDSFVDRLADAAPLAGLAIFWRHDAIALAIVLMALVASSLVSYARAKADVYGLKLPQGLMRRHERIAYLIVALLLAPIAPRASVTGALEYPATLAGVAIIGAVGFYAAFTLVKRTREALRARR